jgi:hypothetical protein
VGRESSAMKEILREIKPSARYFWCNETQTGLVKLVEDHNANRTKRPLPENEIAAMALNEVAAERGRGFFFHARGRESWKSSPGEGLCPAKRVPSTPG